jgi:hypothetical protein
MNALSFSALLLLAASAPADADTWPVWRGDSAMTGVSSTTFQFPLKLAWKFTAANPIKATAVSDGKHFFIGDGKGVFRALKADDG